MALVEDRLTADGVVTYDKVAVAIQTLKDYEAVALQKYDGDGVNGYYVCISGGKDSSVIQQLCIMAGVKCQFYHSHTGLDHPETVYFIRREKKRLEELGYSLKIRYPKETLESLVKRKKMLPTRLARYCCAELKETGGRDRVIVTGVRKAESTQRKSRALAETIENKKSDKIVIQNDNTDTRRSVEQCLLLGTISINVIIDWTDEEVWEFIKKYNVPYNPLYDMGYKRVGCVGCPMSTKKRQELDNMPKYKERWMRLCKYFVESGIYTKFHTAKELYDWWTEKDGKTTVDENQIGFELEDI
jgi:phosphoadenosine phosphosulfate reductase